MSITIPFIFFGVAAFLLNVALGRLVTAQREQIAALKALGFPTAPLVLHYLKLVAVIVLFGSALGVAGGVVFGHAMIASYHGFFRLPVLVFELTPWSAARRHRDQFCGRFARRPDGTAERRQAGPGRRDAPGRAAALSSLVDRGDCCRRSADARRDA